MSENIDSTTHNVITTFSDGRPQHVWPTFREQHIEAAVKVMLKEPGVSRVEVQKQVVGIKTEVVATHVVGSLSMTGEGA